MSITKQQFAVSLAKIINYLKADEKKDYESTGGASCDHIYLDIVTVKNFMLNNPDFKSDFKDEYLSRHTDAHSIDTECKYNECEGMDCVVIESSHGTFYADLVTGEVIKRDICCDKQPPSASCNPTSCNTEYTQIQNFDLEEWESFYKAELPPHLDILDVGYWLEDGRYIPAEDDYRKEASEHINKGD